MRKGYQDTDRAPRAAVVTKLKGAAVAGTARRLWDAADYARPPQVWPGPRAGRGGKSFGKTLWERNRRR